MGHPIGFHSAIKTSLNRNNQKKMSKQKKNINLIEGLPEPEEDIENQTPSNIDKTAVIP